MSLHQTARAADTMTPEDRAMLLKQGWQPAVIDSLTVRGFRPCKPDLIAARFNGIDPSRTAGFIRQTCIPHLHITVDRQSELHEVLEAIDTAIYEAGQHWMHSQIAWRWNTFLTALRTPNLEDPLASLTARLAALEDVLSENA